LNLPRNQSGADGGFVAASPPTALVTVLGASGLVRKQMQTKVLTGIRGKCMAAIAKSDSELHGNRINLSIAY